MNTIKVQLYNQANQKMGNPVSLRLKGETPNSVLKEYLNEKSIEMGFNVIGKIVK